jgi:hypothetical protein
MDVGTTASFLDSNEKKRLYDRHHVSEENESGDAFFPFSFLK